VPTAPRRAQVRQVRQQSRERIVAAATQLIRTMPYAALSVDEVMRRAGLGRTIFYRHFDDLGDLILRAGREAIDDLYETQRILGEARIGAEPDDVRRAIEPVVAVYERHGPLLRAIAEAATGDERVNAGQHAIRRRFDELAEQALRRIWPAGATPPADLAETARALNLMNESYLTEAFGREPRVPPETAVQTLTEIWDAVVHRGRAAA
jgi:TetR/AcrR family transcriptional regulator, ethionamide resistance regulator